MAADRLEYRLPPQFTLRSLFVLTAVIGLLLGILVPWVRASRDAAHVRLCANNLRQIGIALHEFHETFGGFPEAFSSDETGRPLHSWRTQLLPFIDQMGWEEGSLGAAHGHLRRNEPWNSRNNSELRAWRIPIYQCPDDNAVSVHNDTSYVAVVGDETAWPGRTATKLSAFGERSSQIILLVEACDSGIHWMEPRELMFGGLECTLNGRSKPGISSKHANGVNVLFVDASARFLPFNTPAKDIKTMLTVRGNVGGSEAGLSRGNASSVDHPPVAPNTK